MKKRLFSILLLPSLAFAEIQGIHYFKDNWQVVCNNGGVCSVGGAERSSEKVDWKLSSEMIFTIQPNREHSSSQIRIEHFCEEVEATQRCEHPSVRVGTTKEDFTKLHLELGNGEPDETLQKQIINALNQQEDILLSDGFWFWKSTFRIPAQGFKEVWQKMLDFQQQVKTLPPESLLLPKVQYVKPLLPERVFIDNSGYPEYRKPSLPKEYTEIYQPLTQVLHSRYGCTNNDTLFFYPLNEKESRLTYACWVDSNVGGFKGWGPHPEHPILDLVIDNRSLNILGNWQDSPLYQNIQQQAKQRYSQCNEMPKFFLDQIVLSQDKRFLIGKCGISDNEWSSSTFSFVWLMDSKSETLLQEWQDTEQQSVSASIDASYLLINTNGVAIKMMSKWHKNIPMSGMAKIFN